jgi:hypothetical protein
VQKTAFVGADGEDVETLDEMSDDEIELTNSFDPLNDTTVTARPPRQKVIQSSNTIRVVKRPCISG